MEMKVSAGLGWMADSQYVMVRALQDIGMTQRQAKLVVRYGIEDAEYIDQRCDLAARRASASHYEAEYVVCRIRFPSPLNGDEFWVGEYDEIGSLTGMDVTPIWSSSDGFNFDPDCIVW